MLGRWVRTVTVIVVRRVHRVGQTIKALLRPARTVTALAGAAALDALRPRSELMAENALLRQQILVLRRTAPPCPRLQREDRLLLVLLARVNRAWRDGLHLVQPDTQLRWHRDLFTILWRRRSRPKNWPSRLRADVIDLIRTMARANGKSQFKRMSLAVLSLRLWTAGPPAAGLVMGLGLRWSANGPDAWGRVATSKLMFWLSLGLLLVRLLQES